MFSIGGRATQSALTSFGLQFLMDFAGSDVVVTTRWWDPVVAFLRLVKPEIIAVFIADGHFSLLNLNKTSNKRDGKNIIESGYCDIYLLPDFVSLRATDQYPGVKYPYRPYYWEHPDISLSDQDDGCFDIVFVYGNDPFFEVDGQGKLLLLVKQICQQFGEQYSIAHVLPRGGYGDLVARRLGGREEIFVGLNSKDLMLSRRSVYLCTPSTIVWQLLAAGGKTALIDVYDEDPCFHPSIVRVSNPNDVADVLGKDEQYWERLRYDVGSVLGTETIVAVLDAIIRDKPSSVGVRTRAWRMLKMHNLRDVLSSLWSMVFKK